MAGACSPRSCRAAYFLNPAMREAIGYPGLEARPIDPDAAPDYLADGLLDSVVARGPVYRRPRLIDCRPCHLLLAVYVTVRFSLKHEEGSPEEADFLAPTRSWSIPGVEAFELMREVSPKNDFRFLTMEFVDRAAYDAYSAHPDHVLRGRALGQRGLGLPGARFRGAVAS